MRTLLLNALSCYAPPELGAAGASGENAVSSDEALSAEDARFAAQTAGDIAAMERLFSDDLVNIHSNGVVDGKVGYIELQRARAVVYRAMRRSDVKVRVLGPVAIITDRAQFEVTVKGEERTVKLFFHSI